MNTMQEKVYTDEANRRISIGDIAGARDVYEKAATECNTWPKSIQFRQLAATMRLAMV